MEEKVRERTEELSKINQSLVVEIEQRRKINKALQASQDRLAEAQRIANIGSWEWDLINDKLTCSDQMFSLLGLAADSHNISFESLLKYIEPHDRDDVEMTIRSSLKTGQSYDIEHRVVGYDGAYH